MTQNLQRSQKPRITNKDLAMNDTGLACFIKFDLIIQLNHITSTTDNLGTTSVEEQIILKHNCFRHKLLRNIN